jgi:methyltransferase
VRRLPPAWYLLVLGGVGATRLVELGLSRRNLGASAAVGPARDGFAAIVALHVGLFLLPPLEIVWRRRWAGRGLCLWAALEAAATGLRWWSIGSLGRSWSVRALVGPGFRPSQRGPYRLIRHPNYLALILEFFALPMLGGAWASAVLLSVLHGGAMVRRVQAEERLLDAEPGYRQLFESKARFLPWIF